MNNDIKLSRGLIGEPYLAKKAIVENKSPKPIYYIPKISLEESLKIAHKNDHSWFEKNRKAMKMMLDYSKKAESPNEPTKQNKIKIPKYKPHEYKDVHWFDIKEKSVRNYQIFKDKLLNSFIFQLIICFIPIILIIMLFWIIL